ncbi:Signal transduction histidine kinase CheA [Minicystis rosea]|nr:Signal transduction histidine kinase CheA [Minicystis rosea]
MGSEYTATETIRESERFVLRRGYRDSDSHPVLLKCPTSKHPSPDVVRQLERERDIAGIPVPSSVLRPIALEQKPDGMALILENFDGIFLDQLLGAPMEIDLFLHVAVKMAVALSGLHDRGVVHKDIRPDNILVDVATDCVKITNFGLASVLPQEQRQAPQTRWIEGSLAYMSPEQTGRMDRAVDHRTDLYSLGITFYEMLTGQLPYHATDPLDWVHHHIAGTPVSPDVLAPGVPEVLSAIVLRLISKVAEDRYQTAHGLEHDLAICLAAWEEHGAIEPFPLGRNDVSDRFQIPQKLYGRDRETLALLACFTRVASIGVPELCLISGYSGIGKSTLVRELQRPVIAARGLFLSGKFDQNKRDIPYSTVIQAFTQGIRQILTEPEAAIAARRERLGAALGGSAQLIVDLIPELELVIGKQPPVAALPPAEERNRFFTVFCRFLGAFNDAGRPLVLFLDDLQWADAGSLALIEQIVPHTDTRDLLLVGAYRDNEVDPTHPLSLALATLRASGARVTDIVLSPLTSEDLGQLVADALHSDLERVRPLATLVEQKTRNNPFFALQFLETLHEQSLLVFDRSARRWCWDLRRIQERGYTDNVVDFMAGKVGRLAPRTRDTVMQAACIGDELDVRTLALLDTRSVDELHVDLQDALRDGLMLRTGNLYRFVHDRVRQAAYLLIPEARRVEMHLDIGRALLAATPRESLEEHIFDVVNQYDAGCELLTDPEEKKSLAALNLIAGRRARASTAFASAIKLLETGIRLLSATSAAPRGPSSFALHFELAACTYLQGDLDRAASLFEEAFALAETRREKASIRRFEVDLYTSKDELDEAVARGLAGLSLFGIDVPSHPTWADVQREYAHVFELLDDRRIEDLIDLPPMTDPDLSAVQDILAVLFAPALSTDRNLPLLVYCLMVNHSLAHGNGEASALAYAYFGMSLGPAFGQYREGYRFGKLGYDLMERRQSSAYSAKIRVIFGDNTLPWAHHLREAMGYLDTAFRTALETGDVTFACYCCNRIVADRLILGHPLPEVFAEAERRLTFTRKAHFDASTQTIVGIERLVQNLRGRTAHASTLSGPGFDEATHEALMDHYPWAIVRCWYYIMKLAARVLSGDYDDAVAAAARAKELLWSTLAHAQEPEYWYYGALALAGRFDTASPEERPAILAALREHEQRLASWSAACVENFGNKHALCVAELARIEDRPLDAMRAYDDAVRLSRENGYVQNEAIANEAAGRFYLARGFEKIAATYLREAKCGYAQWGADGKVAQLERQYPSFFEPVPERSPNTIAAHADQLDLLAVLQASQAISREIVLTRLMETLVHTIMAQAGAQRGYLLLASGSELHLEAEAYAGPTGTQVVLSPPPRAVSAVPESIISYVRRSREAVVLDDASRPNLFSTDPSIASRRPRSLLCLPILRQAELVGILYLENNLISGAFTRERLTVVELLASQAAISLQNATLFTALRRGEQQLRAIIDNSMAVIYVKDLDGRNLLVNRRYKEVLGLTRDDQVIGKTDYDLYPKETVDVVRTNDLAVIAAMKEMECEEAVPHQDGVHTYISLKFPLCDASGAPYALCGISTDITHRVEAERERMALLHEAQEALRVRDEFLSIASHELKTPLTPLRLQMQLLQRRLAGPELAENEKLQSLRKLVATSDHNLDRLTKLVEQLLDVSRISAGKLALQPEDVDLSALVREVSESFREELVRTRCALTLDAGVPVTGSWDRFRVEQVVVNLLTNAMKYGAAKPISIRVWRAGDLARLSVLDHGIGIAKDAQERIFGRFERATSTRSFGGLGLGLYITRQIVEAHGGRILVSSDPGHGATFTVELPLQRAAALPSA